MGKLAEPDCCSDTGLWYGPTPSQRHPLEWGRPVMTSKLALRSTVRVSFEPWTIASFTWSSSVRLGFLSPPEPISRQAKLNRHDDDRQPTAGYLILDWSLSAEWACHHIMSCILACRVPILNLFGHHGDPPAAKKRGFVHRVCMEGEWFWARKEKEGLNSHLTPQQGGHTDPKTLAASLHSHF